MGWNAVRLAAVVLAATTILGSIACNQTEGPCYRREDIQPSGSGGAGGGVLGPGWGGYGDVPPKPQSTTDPEPVACDVADGAQNDDGSQEAGLKVFCLKADHGPVCSDRCMAKGVGCVPFAVHPYKADGGIGKLYACNTLFLGFMCSFAYPNGDSCHYTFGSPFPTTCTYTGKD
jgi:hypothetical protein